MRSGSCPACLSCPPCASGSGLAVPPVPALLLSALWGRISPCAACPYTVPRSGAPRRGPAWFRRIDGPGTGLGGACCGRGSSRTERGEGVLRVGRVALACVGSFEDLVRLCRRSRPCGFTPPVPSRTYSRGSRGRRRRDNVASSDWRKARLARCRRTFVVRGEPHLAGDLMRWPLVQVDGGQDRRVLRTKGW